MNPCVDNLEWVTEKENLNHGTIQKRKSERKSIPVNEYTVEGKFVRTWKSSRKIAEYINACELDDFKKILSIIL